MSLFSDIKSRINLRKVLILKDQWKKYFPSVKEFLSVENLRSNILDELDPIKKIAFPKSKEDVYRTITLVAITNAILAGLPGKMGIGVVISIALEVGMAVSIANHYGFHEVKKENIYKYLGTVTTVILSIIFLFKEILSATFSVFSSFTGPINPLIPAELLVTNLFGIIFLVGFKEMKSKGSFNVPILTFYSIVKETISLTNHQYEFVKNKPPEIFKKVRKKLVSFFKGEVDLKDISNSEIRGDAFTVLCSAQLLDKNYSALEGPLGQKFIEAVRQSFPTQIKPDASLDDIRNHLMSYDSDQLQSLIDKNIKGKLFEILVKTRENADGNEWSAEQHPDINHPGTDLVLTNSETGEQIEVQLKSTFNKSYVETEMEKNPDTIFIVSDEVAAKINDPRVIPAGLTNDEVSNIARDKAKKFIDGKIDIDDLVINVGGTSLASGVFSIVPYFIAYKKKKISNEQYQKVLETLIPNSTTNSINLILKYSAGGMLYLWWRPARLIIGSLFDDEKQEEPKISQTEKKYSRRELLKLSFIKII
ncbi:MAG: hypothetical protein MRY23_01935 [Pelagibacteraceae bacterium]|nr:hypothetical protein [Pelagibacteraceae bacterium]MCI5079652.1 hypothetical protein [Pelagibacteraceae bacterium]